MGKGVLLALAAGGCLAVLLLLTLAGDGDPAPLAQREAADNAGVEAGTPPAPHLGARPVTAERQVLTGPAEQTEGYVPPRILVRVVAADGRTPVPGARVRVLSREQAPVPVDLDLTHRPGWLPATEGLARYGRKYLADRLGRALVAAPRSGPLLVDASVPGLWGMVRIGEEKSEDYARVTFDFSWTNKLLKGFGIGSLPSLPALKIPVPTRWRQVVLPLHREGDLRVRVVDTRGTPVSGVPLRLDLYTKAPPPPKVRLYKPRLNRVGYSSTASSGQDGVARFRHAYSHMMRIRHTALAQQTTKEDPPGTPQRWMVRPRLPLPCPTALELPVDLGPDRVETLVLPDTGRVTIRVITGPPATYPGEFMVYVQVADRSYTLNDPLAGQLLALPTIAGVATFPLMGLGLKLKATVLPAGDWEAEEAGFFLDLDSEYPSAQFTGPTLDRREVVRQITYHRPRGWLTGRVVNDVGTPLRSTCLSARFCRKGAKVLFRSEDKPITLHTDKEGRFRLQVPDFNKGMLWDSIHDFDLDILSGDCIDYRALAASPWLSEDPEKSDKRIKPTGIDLVLAAAGPQDSPGLSARITITFPRPQGCHDLGTITMAGNRLKVAGELVDDRGRPVPGVRVFALTEGDRQWSWWKRRTDSLLDEDDWGPGRTGRTDDRGRFSIHTVPGQGTVRVFAAAKGHHCPDKLDVPWGSRGVRPALDRSGGLAGSIRPVPGLAYDAIHLFLRYHHPPTGIDRSRFLGHQWKIKDTTLAPGRADLLICRATGKQVDRNSSNPPPADTVLHTITDLQIRPGTILADPRLQGVDLSDRVWGLTLTLTDHRRKRLDCFGNSIFAGPGFTRDLTPSHALNPIRLVLPTHAEELLIHKSGHGLVRLNCHPGATRIALPPALEASLILPTGVWPVAAKAALHARLTPLSLGRDGRLSSPAVLEAIGSISVEFDKTGKAPAALPATGTYKLEWYIRPTPPTSIYYWHPCLPHRTATLTFGPDRASRDHRLEITAADIAAALTEVRAKD